MTPPLDRVQADVIAWLRADQEWNQCSTLSMMIEPDRWRDAWRERARTLSVVRETLGKVLHSHAPKSIAALDDSPLAWDVARRFAEDVMQKHGLRRTSEPETAHSEIPTVFLSPEEFNYLRRNVVEYWAVHNGFLRNGKLKFA